MKIIYLLIPLSLLLLSLAVWAFFWAVRNGQFDDLDTPSLDVLDDADDIEQRRNQGATGKSTTNDSGSE
jgi:cbb3-type cytochrome oxidase maturation protein